MFYYTVSYYHSQYKKNDNEEKPEKGKSYSLYEVSRIAKSILIIFSLRLFFETKDEVDNFVHWNYLEVCCVYDCSREEEEV